MATITKCFGALVASGNGNKCNYLKAILRKNMLVIDKETGKSIVWVHKFASDKYPEQHMEFRKNLAEDMNSLYNDVPSVLLEKNFYYSDCSAMDPEWKIELDQWHFSDMLETAMKNGRWNGSVGNG
jgi:hypothetical protein